MKFNQPMTDHPSKRPLQHLKKIALTACLSVLAFGSNAQVTQLFNTSQMSTTYLNNFESVANSGPVTFNSAGLVFASMNSSNITPSGSKGLLSTYYYNGWWTGEITANLSTDHTAVGMFFGNDDRCCSNGFYASLSAYKDSNLLGTVSVAANMNDYADQFIGLSSSTGFNRVMISYGRAPLYVYIDDFRLGAVAAVPEPETYAMLLAGLGLIGAASRRRKAAAQATA